jgi:subtilisin family serine protease
MGSGEERPRTASDKILRPQLLLSAALAALIVAAPAGDRTSARAMSLGSSFGAVRLNSGPHNFAPRGGFGRTAIGNGREIGVVGHVDPGKGSSGNPCKPGRNSLGRCVVNNGGDHPGSGDVPRLPRGTIGIHPPHWVPPRDPILPANPTVVTTHPTATGIGSQSPGRPGPQAVRRSGSGVPPVNERRYRPDEVVAELAASATNLQTDALARKYRLARLQSVNFQLGGTTLVRWRITDRRSVPDVVRALETDPAVLSAQPNYLFALQDETATSAAPREGDPAQYMLDKMHLPQAHELARGYKVLVAVIDSGVDVAHPDLAGDIAGTFDALGTGLKAHAHGTAIAGAIAAHGRLMGAAPAAQILAVRAFSGDGADDGTTFAIMSGLNWAVSHGARVVNMSFAGPQDPGIARTLAAAHEKGVLLVAAAGNKGAKSPPLYPAADPNVIAVTATDASDQLPAFANRGRYIAVAAPGVDLMLLAPNGTLQFSSGTSFSAAYVTGTAALMLERRPDLVPDTLRQALTGTAHHLESKGIDKAADDQSGAGLVDAYQAVLSLVPAPIDAANATPAAVRR